MNYSTVFNAYAKAAHRAHRFSLAHILIENVLEATAGGIRTDANAWAAHVAVASNDYGGPSMARAIRQAQTFGYWLDKRLRNIDRLKAEARKKREAAK